MARLMSVSLTEPQVRARAKTVTRRKGWLVLKEGDRLTLCKKVQGRRKGEPLERIVDVEVVTVRREPLCAITPADVAAEGFPDWTPDQFAAFFCSTHKGCDLGTVITRIEWRYLPCPQCQDTGIVTVDTDCGGCSGYPGITHEPACGVEPCPEGCWDRLHPSAESED